MYIIMRCQDNAEEILNIIYSETDFLTIVWINQYLLSELEGMTMCPTPPNTKNVSYHIEKSAPHCSKLIRQYKKIHKGYVYNSSEKLSDTICTVKYLEFHGNNTPFSLPENPLWSNINIDINNRVLKHLDNDSLRQVLGTVQQKMNSKKFWTNVEFTNLMCETLKDFRKELYSSIAKKMKRLGIQHKKYELKKIS